jgi:hypothetical protein
MERLTVLATDFKRVVTPYQAEGWYQALRDCQLLDRYPNLIHNIYYGSPIGNPPTPSSTFIPPNMTTTDLNPSFIDNYLAGEVAAGRMSGPYSIEEAHAFFGGHFRTAPLGLVEKEPGLGKWRMIQNNSAVDAGGDSTNSWLDAKDILVRWHSCAAMADIVSCCPFDCMRCLYLCSFFAFVAYILCLCGVHSLLSRRLCLSGVFFASVASSLP